MENIDYENYINLGNEPEDDLEQEPKGDDELSKLTDTQLKDEWDRVVTVIKNYYSNKRKSEKKTHLEHFSSSEGMFI